MGGNLFLKQSFCVFISTLAKVGVFCNQYCNLVVNYMECRELYLNVELMHFKVVLFSKFSETI